MKSFCGRAVLSIAMLICAAPAGGPVFGQTNPTALSLPVNQNFGVAAFSTMPTGFAAWNGVAGGTTTTQAIAEASAPTGNAPVMTNTPASTGTGGCYGYSVSGDARFGILTSSNTSNGTSQLAMAINTLGQTNISVAYNVINAVANPRTVGLVCQYRVGTSGGWTTLSGTGNPYVQIGGTAGAVTSANLLLPAAAENQAVVQIRWATWRGTESGSSSGLAVDNIAVTALGSGPVVSSVALSGGPSYDLGTTAIATVTLTQAPATSATVNLTSGAFAPAVVSITAPDTTGQVEVSMDNAGTYTAVATAATGCAGAATSAAFDVIGAPAAAFNSTGVNTVDDSTSNGNGYIEPGESNIKLYCEISNSGTANATGVSGTLSSLTGTATIGNAVQGYPNLAMGTSGTNATAYLLTVSPSHVCGSTINLQLAVTSNEGSSTFVLTLPTCPPAADPYGPPADYYTTATGTGATLKSQLHNIISKDYWNGFLSSSTHNARSYDAAKSGLQVTDLDSNNSADLILVYTGVSVPKAWDGGSTWNREHQWPDSLGINGTMPAYGDLHHLRPCNPSLNSTRGNSPYGLGSGYFDPDHGSADRGRCSRAMFYMNTRYNGTSPNPGLNLVLVNGQPSGSQMGDLAKMVEWHYAYPVDDAERRRNYRVFSNSANPNYYQGNRNPYIDHPEYVWTIYGTGPNDSELYFGANPPPDGASSAAVNLGTVLVNASVPAAQPVVLNKSGATPTTFNVILGGAASSPSAGTRQAFVGGAQTRSISAGLATSTTTAGLKSGTITVDNTDLTSAGAGMGSADGNDTISISLAVLDHSNASFDSPVDQNSRTIDFGDVVVGSGAVNQGFTVYNLPHTAGYTAGLEIDSVSGAGDTTLLTTDLAPTANIAAGAGQGFTATFNPTGAGTFSATYTVGVSDQNLPGATAGTSLVLTITGRGVQPSCIAADANCDLAVTLADVSAFVDDLLGVSSPCSACASDMNGDLSVNGADVQLFVQALTGPL